MKVLADGDVQGSQSVCGSRAGRGFLELSHGILGPKGKCYCQSEVLTHPPPSPAKDGWWPLRQGNHSCKQNRESCGLGHCLMLWKYLAIKEGHVAISPNRRVRGQQASRAKVCLCLQLCVLWFQILHSGSIGRSPGKRRAWRRCCPEKVKTQSK